MIYAHLESTSAHTVGVSQQGHGGGRREDEAHLDLGRIFIIGLSASVPHAYKYPYIYKTPKPDCT